MSQEIDFLVIYRAWRKNRKHRSIFSRFLSPKLEKAIAIWVSKL